MTALDRRHVRYMGYALSNYRTGRSDLGGLIREIEILLNTLEDVPDLWRDTIREHWEDLEIIYSLAVVREMPVESERNRPGIDQAVAAIQGQVDAMLAEIGDDEEGEDA